MNYEKPIYYITIMIVLISIATSPVLAESFKIEDKVNEKVNNQNNTVVAKAATSNGSVCTNASSNSNSNTNINNASKTNSTTQSSTITVSGNEAPKKLKQAEILKASVYVNKYKKLPNKVTIRGYDFSIPEYTYLLSNTIYYNYNKKTTQITVKYYIKNPTGPTGTKIKGKLNSKQYY